MTVFLVAGECLAGRLENIICVFNQSDFLLGQTEVTVNKRFKFFLQRIDLLFPDSTVETPVPLSIVCLPQEQLPS